MLQMADKTKNDDSFEIILGWNDRRNGLEISIDWVSNEFPLMREIGFSSKRPFFKKGILFIYLV